MDPMAGAATSVAKVAGGVVGRQIATRLGRITFRFRVARAAIKRARNHEIVVAPKDLHRWLASDTTRSFFESGVVTDSDAQVRELEALISQQESRTQDAGHVLLQIVIDESHRRLPQRDAHVETATRVERAVRASEHRVILASQARTDALSTALMSLHPWRREEVQEAVEHWPDLADLMITLIGQRERGATLSQWAHIPPTQLEGAPSGVWAVLAALASDYGVPDAVLRFTEVAITRGAPSAYWWARAGLAFGTADEQSAETAADLWRRAQPPHPMAAAAYAIHSGDYGEAESVLLSWKPDTPNDEVIKAILETAAAVGLSELNRAIEIGLRANSEHPEASGITLRTAEVLLSRGHYGESDHPLQDFARSFDLAVQARDSRREWLGDSVAAILVAIQAAALGNDLEHAWELTQLVPDGSAMEHEVLDARLRRETAILAATLGRTTEAKSIAAELKDDYVTRTVQGWEAYGRNDQASAEASWMAAWEAAPNDTARLQTLAALAPLGGALPNLEKLSQHHHRAVEELREVHEVMSHPGDQLALLRARASKSERLTVLLAERLAEEQGEPIDSARVLETGGTRRNHPLLMRMSAYRYMAGDDYVNAERAATMALSMGGPRWAGRLGALKILFDALERQGKFEQSLPVAREMVAIAPDNLDVRWNLIYCLTRKGDGKAAFATLSYGDTLASPRNAADARTWIGLVAAFDQSPKFVQRSLAMMAEWTADADLQGIFLAQIYSGLIRAGRKASEEDIEELHRRTEKYTRENPESTTFRSIQFDESDPLGSLSEELRRSDEPPALKAARSKVEDGQLPLGILSDLFHRSYAEVCLRRASGLLYGHDLELAANGQNAFAVAITEGAVVIDTSAVAVLSSFDVSIVDDIWGRLLTVEATNLAYQDALTGQQALSLRSTMSIGWDADAEQPSATEISEDAADELARRMDRSVEILAGTNRRGWPNLTQFAEYTGDGAWLSALDYAVASGRVFWCDDRLLRRVAAEKGLKTFGTADALEYLEKHQHVSAALAETSRAVLIHNYYVDLGLPLEALRLAGQMAGWEPHGAAAALTRPHAWRKPQETLNFLGEAIGHVAYASPSAVRGWVGAAARGVISLAGNDPQGASKNLELLLTFVMTQSWLRPDILLFVVQGIRDAIGADGLVVDPLRAVLTALYADISSEYSTPAAAEFLILLVGALDEMDRGTAANVILTAPQDGV